jgi:Coenzyme Q (ubiquinone) biosynthesis protein Coq4
MQVKSMSVWYTQNICSQIRLITTQSDSNSSSPPDDSHTHSQFASESDSKSPQSRMSNLSMSQRVFVGTGAAILAMLDPHRGDLVATLGEVSGDAALRNMLQRMQNDETGRQILSDRPIVSSETVDLQKLAKLDRNTFGYAYAYFMLSRGYSPDERTEVRFVDDEDLAYVMLRYRQTHDFLHVLLGLPTDVLGELVQKVCVACVIRCLILYFPPLISHHSVLFLVPPRPSVALSLSLCLSVSLSLSLSVVRASPNWSSNVCIELCCRSITIIKPRPCKATI